MSGETGVGGITGAGGPDSLLRVATVNLNGIRAAHRRGLTAWLDEAAPDVLLLQEVRAPADVAADLLGSQWQGVWVPCRIRGRAGVAMAVHRDRADLVGAQGGVDGAQGARPFLYADEVDVDSGRWVEAEVETSSGGRVRVVSAYFHSGEVGTAKQEAKMAHLARIDTRMGELLSCGANVLVAGDFNVVLSRADIKNWTPNHNKRAGVLDEEIAHLAGWLDAGWVDVTRVLAGEVQGPYTWWSWRGKAFDNDAGWRIDHQFTTPSLGQMAKRVEVCRAASYDARFSDHAPLVVDYEV
ncbi:endonuclease/exonuclease/phosphatase family protein [Schaalia sp. 19OD2882]|uniref:exodeoxyribonuclease III n=1 Tax=Schaalia sp. 19OD2882 TaxID=2794089 RepID=UPI001C1E93F9|nr:exodeoxyribonuclease III [Schaalia sp. 19OD2882]QWW19156.1 endonuclease/exonuclease/phosphatase family protein [Schaalia sp. 19OD2882]